MKGIQEKFPPGYNKTVRAVLQGFVRDKKEDSDLGSAHGEG